MVSNRCKILVAEQLKKLEIPFSDIQLGEIEIPDSISDTQQSVLQEKLRPYGLEIIQDRERILIEKIKSIIVEVIHSETYINLNFPDYLSEKLNYNAQYLSRLFLKSQDITLQKFIILHRIERIKELISYGELSLMEISLKMGYSSLPHLSNQFKQYTSLTPMQFKRLKDKNRFPLDEIGTIHVQNLRSNAA